MIVIVERVILRLTYICFIIRVHDDFSNTVYELNGRRKLQQFAKRAIFRMPTVIIT